MSSELESPTKRLLEVPSPCGKSPAEIARLTGGINAVPESQVSDGSLAVQGPDANLRKCIVAMRTLLNDVLAAEVTFANQPEEFSRRLADLRPWMVKAIAESREVV